MEANRGKQTISQIRQAQVLHQFTLSARNTRSRHSFRKKGCFEVVVAVKFTKGVDLCFDIAVELLISFIFMFKICRSRESGCRCRTLKSKEDTTMPS